MHKFTHTQNRKGHSLTRNSKFKRITPLLLRHPLGCILSSLVVAAKKGHFYLPGREEKYEDLVNQRRKNQLGEDNAHDWL